MRYLGGRKDLRSGTRIEAVKLLFEAEGARCLSELGRVELMGVFHRRLREGKWTQTDFLAAVRQFSIDDVGGFWTWLPLDKTIVEAAAKTYATLPATVLLRLSDCLHLMTALHHNFADIYTYDTQQSLAAATLGLTALNSVSQNEASFLQHNQAKPTAKPQKNDGG